MGIFIRAMARLAVAVLVVALLVELSVQRGTIYLNEIQPVPDAITGYTQIPIECTLWDETTVYLDNFNGIPAPGTGNGHGVEVDGVLIDGFSWVFPNELVVGNNVIMAGLLQPDGGFFSDDGEEGDADGDGFDFAFAVKNDTGDTTIAGTLDILGGLNNQDDVTNPISTFTVEDDTGMTTIEGLTRPNGGIDVRDQVFLVQPSGIVFGDGNLSVERDIFFGDNKGSRAKFEHWSNDFTPVPEIGGDTVLKGQDAALIGGNLVISPGFSTGPSTEARPGSIFLGRRLQNEFLSVSRQPTDEGNGGDLIVGGQISSGNGGSVELRAGSSNTGFGSGGDLILDVGMSTVTGRVANGRIYFGNPEDGPNIPMVIRRPNIADSDHAGNTLFYAQDTFDARGGDLTLRAGSGNLFGGRIHLEPGKNGPIEGDIIFGTLEETRPENLFIRRDTDTSNLNDAAPTYIRGQESTGGDGGDLYLVAGDGTDTRSGSIYLQPGVREDGTNTGAVWWGNNANNADLFVLRPPTYIYPGQDTALIAQNTVGAAFVGGDMFVQAGDGATFGGDLNIFAGNGEKEFGGSVFITSTFASTAIHGGDIEVNAGEGRNAGGDIFFFGGNSGFDDVTAGNFRSMGGDIYIHAGAGSGPDFSGRIVFQNGDDFILDAVPIFFEAGDDDDLFSITDTDDSDDVYRMDIFPDGDNGIFTLSSITSPSPLNPFFMLRERQTITGLATPYVDGNPYLSETDLRNLINDIHTAMVAVADALENHGLIDVTFV